jgi:putrescine---pyruvate transaminase
MPGSVKLRCSGLGGIMVSARIAAPFWDDDGAPTFRHGLTYQAHATGCAAAHANLDIIDREDLVARVRGLEATLEETLRPLEDHPAVVDVRTGIGLLAGVQLRDAELVSAVVDRCWERGVLTRAIGDGDTLHVSPPFVITDDEIRVAADTFAEAISEVYERAGDGRLAGRAA